MQTGKTALLLLGLGASVVAMTATEALAADLSASPAARTTHRRLHVVRDYDGTPVMFRNDVAIPVPRAQPLFYLNGQPVASDARVRPVAVGE